MTTTVTVKTHDWPVRVTTSDNHSFSDPATGHYRNGYATEVVVVLPHKEQSFHLTDTRSINFAELPADWTPESDGRGANCAAGSKSN